MELNNKSTVWRFVEAYLPNYSQDEDVALSNDLECIIDNEVEEGSRAYSLQLSIEEVLYCKNIAPERDDIVLEAELRLLLVNAKIYESAIEAYLQTLND